jgi:hypothetical protein
MSNSGSKRQYVIVKRRIRTDATGGMTTAAIEEMTTDGITDKDSRRTSIKKEFSIYQEGARSPLRYSEVV